MTIKIVIKRIIEKSVGFIIKLLNLNVFSYAINNLGLDNGGTFKTSGEENFLSNILPKLIDKKPIIFDIGAHIGDYTKILRKKIPAGKIYCFEPNPTIFEKLKDKISNEKNCIAYNIAISDSNIKTFDLFYSTKVTMYDYTQLASGNKNVYRELYNTNDCEKIVCQSESIDSFCAKHSIENIDFIKIDTEGNELNVIKGAKKMLSDKKISVIQFEFNEMNILNRIFLRDFENELKGFNLFRIKNNGNLIRLQQKSRYNEIFLYQNIVAIKKEIGVYK